MILLGCSPFPPDFRRQKKIHPGAAPSGNGGATGGRPLIQAAVSRRACRPGPGAIASCPSPGNNRNTATASTSCCACTFRLSAAAALCSTSDFYSLIANIYVHFFGTSMAMKMFINIGCALFDHDEKEHRSIYVTMRRYRYKELPASYTKYF